MDYYYIPKAEFTMHNLKYTYIFDVVCIVHHPTICIYANKMHKILVIRLHFLLDALHVSD